MVVAPRDQQHVVPVLHQPATHHPADGAGAVDHESHVAQPRTPGELGWEVMQGVVPFLFARVVDGSPAHGEKRAGAQPVGSTRRATVPPPSRSSSATVPPWSIAICATIDKPRPDPGNVRAPVAR